MSRRTGWPTSRLYRPSSVGNWLFDIAWVVNVFAKRARTKNQKLQRAIESHGDLNTYTTKVKLTLMCEIADLQNKLRFTLPTKFTPSAVNYQ